MSTILRDCVDEDIDALAHWLVDWVGTSRWPEPGSTPSPTVRGDLIWHRCPLQKVALDERTSVPVALLALHELDLHDRHAVLSVLADPAADVRGAVAEFVRLALAQQPIRKLTFEIAVDREGACPWLPVGAERVGRRHGHVRRDARTFADVDIFELVSPGR